VASGGARRLFDRAANAIIRTVEKALEVAGGGSFYRSATLERLFRDVQAGSYHPMPDRPRERLTGRVLLGLDIDG
jgi:alkylation response protein AidB-like acyl-CoA dehydrogenase